MKLMSMLVAPPAALEASLLQERTYPGAEINQFRNISHCILHYKLFVARLAKNAFQIYVGSVALESACVENTDLSESYTVHCIVK